MGRAAPLRAQLEAAGEKGVTVVAPKSGALVRLRAREGTGLVEVSDAKTGRHLATNQFSAWVEVLAAVSPPAGRGAL